MKFYKYKGVTIGHAYYQGSFLAYVFVNGHNKRIKAKTMTGIKRLITKTLKEAA